MIDNRNTRAAARSTPSAARNDTDRSRSAALLIDRHQFCTSRDVNTVAGSSPAGVFVLNYLVLFIGWLQEKYETPGSRGWLPYTFGCIAGVVPWLAVAVYVIAPGSSTDVEPPTFVYGIVISLFILFNCFAVVQFLQYKRVGKWSDYLYGERTYITLSLVAKSLLAWQIFAGTLAPS